MTYATQQALIRLAEELCSMLQAERDLHIDYREAKILDAAVLLKTALQDEPIDQHRDETSV